MEQKRSPTLISLGMQALSSLKLSFLICFFFILGLVVRNLVPDPLADFFDEMERSGRLTIEEDPKEV